LPVSIAFAHWTKSRAWRKLACLIRLWYDATSVRRKRNMRPRLELAALLAVMSASTAFAQGERYPSKPIRWVVPYAAGGGTDVIVRPIALMLGEALGQPIPYDNRGGGGGVIAGEIVAKAAPDGYTMLVASPAVMTINAHLFGKMPFDPIKDFAAITKFASTPNMLAAHPSFPPRTIQELVDYAKANPGKVNWASSGTGAGGHLGLELFRLKAGIKVVHVPYKGAGPALVGLLGGNVDVLFANPGVFMQHLKAGRLRSIAVASQERLAVLPDVPTVNESGFPGFESGSWYGLVAPAGTPDRIIKLMHAASLKVVHSPEIGARLAADGATAVGDTPEHFAKTLRDDSAMWGRVIKEAGIKVE
jgi:tripartite-type tricarboxylate transporter receptor subunit TctC